MAEVTKTYLDLEGLKAYDAKIKDYSNKGDQVIKDLIGVIPEKVGEKEIATLVEYIDEKMSTSGASGEAKDITLTDEDGLFEATTVEGALAEIAKAEGLIAQAVSGEAARAAAVEGDLDTLTTEDKSSLVAAINELDQAVVDAQADADAALEAIGKPAEGEEEATGLYAEIEALKGIVGEESVADQVDSAIEDLDLENTYAAKEYEGKVDTLVGDDTEKSVREIAAEELAKQLVPENAKEALDTLEEIAAWIQAHPDDAATMNSDIAALKEAVGEPAKEAVGEEGQEGYEPAVPASGLFKTIADVDKATDSRLDALEVLAGIKEGEEDASLAERIATVESDVESLEGRVTALEEVSYVAITTDEIDALFADAPEEEGETA